MSNVAEIKAAVETLPANERLALFQWLSQDAAIQANDLAVLRAAVDEGDRDLAEGRYLTLETDEDFRELADNIKQSGRKRLGKSA